jgi:hypothetical protein
MVDGIQEKQEGTFEYHHPEMVKQHVLGHVKEHMTEGEMILETEHVNAGVMECEMAHGKLKQTKMQQG